MRQLSTYFRANSSKVPSLAGYHSEVALQDSHSLNVIAVEWIVKLEQVTSSPYMAYDAIL